MCDRDLQREINSGFNVAESWHRANTEIFCGKARDIASNRRDEQDRAMQFCDGVRGAGRWRTLKRLQRAVSRKQRGNNRDEARKRLALEHAKVADTCAD